LVRKAVAQVTKKRAKIVVCVLALAFLLALGVGLEWTARRKHEAALAAVQSGWKTPSELSPAPIPAEENAAPLYEQVFALLVEEKLDAPSLAALAKNERQVQEYLENNKDALAKLREAVEKPKCRFDVDYSRGFEVLLPHLSNLRTCVRLLAWDALYKRRRGDLPGAVESCSTAWRVGSAVAEEPLLISYLVECALDAIAAGATRQVVEDADLSAELIGRLLGELKAREPQDGRLRTCMEMEKALGLDIFRRVIRDPKAFGSVTLGSRGATRSWSDRLIMSPLWRPVFMNDRDAYGRTMSAFLKTLSLPFPQRLDAYDLDAEVNNLSRHYVVTRMIAPGLSRVVVEDAAHRARVDTCRLGLALKLFKAKRGAYSKELNELAELGELRELRGEGQAKLPVDPFSGQPYRYVVKGDGFVVYSVGRNRVDDGGVEDPKNAQKGDIVFEATK